MNSGGTRPNRRASKSRHPAQWDPQPRRPAGGLVLIKAPHLGLVLLKAPCHWCLKEMGLGQTGRLQTRRDSYESNVT